MEEGFQVIGFDWRYLYVNAAAGRHGRRAPEELVGRTMMECYPGVEQTDVFRALKRCMGDRQPAALENEFTYPDGKKAWFDLRIQPCPGGVAVLSVDITERKLTAELVGWLSLAVEQGPTSVIMTDVDGGIQYVNPKFTEVTGYSLDDVRGKTPRMLKSGQTPPEVYRDLWATITAGHPWHGEVLNRKKSGELYWDAMWVYPLREDSGAVTRFLALKEDITARKRAEEGLRASEQRLRTLFETVRAIVLVLDSSGIVEYVNPFFLGLTGYARNEVVGKNWFEHFLPKAEQRAVHGAFLELLERDFHPHYENPVLTKAGEERMIAWSNTVVRDAQGRATGTISIGEDVTERLELEQQLRQAQKMEAVGQLAGGVAHDFNNVLTAIFGYADLMMEDLPAESPARRDVEDIRTAAERAAALTRQLLAFSRRQVLQPVVLRLNDLVEELEKMLGRLIGEDVELRLTLSPDAGNVRIDAGQLEQVLMNLVVNARDAMPAGGKLLIETANADLSEQYTEIHRPVVPGRYVLLAVSDTGIGMDAETKARIFEPFFTTKEVGHGTGLGLSTVYGIVKQSGGYIWAYSEVGRGTTFKIYLPRVDAPVERVAPPPETRPPAGTETILLAEDNEMVRPLAAALLRKFGYTVLEAENGARAVAVASDHQGPIHLLVSDVIMPGASGRELARRIAATRPETRVLYVSGYTDDAIVQHGMLEPGLHFLQKPFTPAALARKVREVLDAK
jgi:PAS domain S-box-containing protein